MIMKRELKSFDFLLLLTVIGLTIFGIIAIGSADRINIPEISRSNFYKQIFYFFTGLVLLLIACMINYSYVNQFYILIYLLNIFLLVFVLFFGQKWNSATRWIKIGGFSFLPSEFAKLFMILFNAKFIDKMQSKINHIGVFLGIIILNIIPIYLIQKQPSLSASLVLLFILSIQLYAGGLSYKYFIPIIIIGIAILVFVYVDIHKEVPFLLEKKILRSYQIKRILAGLYPNQYKDEAYQTLKSISAIGSGQLSGKGLYQSTLNQLTYLPEPNNDFIFSVIGEEFGFTGCVALLVAMIFLIFRCILICFRTKDFMGSLIVIGVTGMLFFQTLVNTAVATGIFPNTGMSLPFISSGGSALWTNMTAIGLVINIGMRKPKSLFEEA